MMSHLPAHLVRQLEAQARAARGFALLVVQGRMAVEEALAALHAAAARAAPAMDAAGRQMAMAWALRDGMAEWQRERDGVRGELRAAMGPLLEERAPAARIHAAAVAANRAAGARIAAREKMYPSADGAAWVCEPFTDVEVDRMVGIELHHALRRLRGGRVPA